MRTRPLLTVIGMLAVMVFTGIQLHVSGQGDLSETYPKGFRGGTCTIESDALLIGYSAYFVPADYAIPEDAISALSVPVLCGKVPQTGVLDVTIDLLYPQSARNWALALSLVRMGKDGSAEAVFSVPPRSYERGTMTHAIRIGKPAITGYTYTAGTKIRPRSAWKYPLPLERNGTKVLLTSGPCFCLLLPPSPSTTFERYSADRFGLIRCLLVLRA